MRAEGLTEFVGDIVLVCTGGPTPVVGSQLPTANFTVSFGADVTSRLLGYSASVDTSPYTSEALLLIDEPGSGLTMGGVPVPGWGPGAPQTLCGVGSVPSSTIGAGPGPGGCHEYAQQLSNGDFVMSGSAGSAVPGANVFAGVWGGPGPANQVTFYGIPIMPPAVANVARVFRMTNIRINANAIAVSGGMSQVSASISISGSTSVPVSQPLLTVGFVQSGLTFQVRTPDDSAVLTASNFSGCKADQSCAYGILRFSENFGTAFKTRVAPTTSTNGQSSSPNPGQNIPGVIYNSESDFIFPGITGTSNNSVAGLADFGTRLKAEFTDVPAGVSIYVATTNVANLVTPPPGNSTTSFAQLVTSGTAADGNGTIPSATAIGSHAWDGTPAVYSYARVPVVNGSATAVWEIVNTNTAVPENFNFPVWVVFGSGATPELLNIAGYLAPNLDPDASSMVDGNAAQQTTYPVPRFTSAPQ
jgi:hypothetical protein